MDDIVFGKLGNDFVCGINAVTLKMLMVQMAANILEQLPSMPISGEEIPATGAGAILAKYANWAPHGFLNALQTQAKFLYEAIPELGEVLYLFASSEKELIAEALRKYQEYKTKVVEEGYKQHGERWGDSTEFNQKDWTDRNFVLA